jgi:endonuclease YncB( thermonuclease family)
MKHDFKRFPELTNSQMQIFYFDSPHKQITEGFMAKVIKVSDGDTIRVTCDFRDFNFPIRIANLAAPELNERGGKLSQSWLENQILDEDVEIILTKERVEKWGRLLAYVISRGLNMTEASVNTGHGVFWAERKQEVGF